MDLKVAVTGSRGFIGSHLSLLLSNQKNIQFFTNQNLDILDKVAVTNWVNSLTELTHFVHLAGMSSVHDCNTNPKLALKINCEATLFLYKVLVKKFPKLFFIFPSTSALYSTSADILNEDHPVLANHPYSVSKLEAEIGLKKLSKDKYSKVCILRLFNHTHKTQSAKFLLPKIYDHWKTNQPNPNTSLMLGNLNLIRDVGSVQDLMRMFILLLNYTSEFPPFEIFNVCTGHGKSLENLVHNLVLKLNFKVNIVSDKNLFRDEAKSIVGDPNKIFHRLGWKPTAINSETLIKKFLEDIYY